MRLRFSASLHPLLYFAILLCLQSCLLGRVDRRPYQQMPYYAQMRQRLDTLTIQSPDKRVTGSGATDTIRAGWAKVNITPVKPISMAGYGNRLGRKYRAVRDSTYIRAVVFENHSQRNALVAADLLIFPPALVRQLQSDLSSIGWQTNQVLFTATHTHNGSGGWAPKLVGRLIAGRYRKREVRRLSLAIVQALRQAGSTTAPIRVGFAQYKADELVDNRLVGEAGTRDTLLSVVKLVKPSGETALLTTFSAHATVLPSANYSLSRDYPGALVDLLERDSTVSMAAFCAGGVGSHSPKKEGKDDEEALTNLASRLAQKILTQLPEIASDYQYTLRSTSVPLALRKPQWRISRNTRLRPWVFYWLYGRYPASLTALQMGSTLWLGTPCDFSGELVAALRPVAEEKRLHLLVTSFNGGYIGYITKDEHYDLAHFETRAMNWFGPYNGAYLTEMMERLIRKF